MNECLTPNKPCAWITETSQVNSLVKDIVEKVSASTIPIAGGGTETNKWKKIFTELQRDWITYTLYTQNTTVDYTHTGGGLSRINKLGTQTNHVDDNGYVWELSPDTPYTGYDESYRTGRKVNVKSFTHGGTVYNIPDALVTLVDMQPNFPESTFSNPWEKYQAYVVKHARIDYTGNEVEDVNWNQFKLLAPMPDDWTYYLYLRSKGSNFLLHRYREYSDGKWSNLSINLLIVSTYTVTLNRFTPTHNSIPAIGVLQHEGGEIVNVLLEQPEDNANYFKIRYGFAVEGDIVPSSDNQYAVNTYNKACDLSTVGAGKTPVVIDQYEAYLAWERQVYESNHFVPRVFNIVDGFTSPNTLAFTSADYTESWIADKKRPFFSTVDYYISVDNSRLVMILQGDPSHGIDNYYRNLVYIGMTEDLATTPSTGNFAVTAGTGELTAAKAGMTYNNIDKTKNNSYSAFGRHSSNGMDSVSMFKGKSGLYFQEYHPAFLTHLPNYPTVGTIPSPLQRLVLDIHGFNASLWTEEIHSSPIYLVNFYEGYRCNLYGVVAIHDHNMIDGEELEMQIGNTTEVYKFFSLNTHINMFSKSPTTFNTSIAILKEVKNN
ncbi:hypothetical protein SAMN05446037_100671 [Anaerovirgula multivorans]|uniref:Uncharacterized protein n=1 Tax=Anaerovirgula multivorans TaxID=312168 RepID=A0A239CNN6_9FIRM|nr:hypothetical protein [Anaerovirgula multivorans]SNS21757.1 hypothetical protein SAMN05446037_100671 [Anaerovirgula multivorans]